MSFDQQNQTGSSKHPVIVGLVGGREGYGVRRAWLGILAGLAARGRTAHINSIAEGSLVEEFRARGITVTVLGKASAGDVPSGVGKVLALGKRVRLQASLASRLTDSARRAGADILLFRSPLEVFLAGWVARRLGIKAFWLMPNSVADTYPLDLNRRLYRWAFRHLNVVPIGNSRHTIETLGDPAKARHFAYLGVDPREFENIDMGAVSRAALGIPDSAAVLGVFARMIEEKGQLRLVEALAALGQEASDVHILLCGGPLDTPYAKRISDFVAASGLGGRVHLLGPTARPQPYYALCDVVVNSRIDPEPFGLSVVEAMIMGKPVFAHSAGGPGETVIDGETGWLVPDPSLSAFVAGLRRVVAERPRWASMGEAALRHAHLNFTSDAMVGRLVAIFDEEMRP